jgi:hypothetical protein
MPRNGSQQLSSQFISTFPYLCVATQDDAICSVVQIPSKEDFSSICVLQFSHIYMCVCVCVTIQNSLNLNFAREWL